MNRPASLGMMKKNRPDLFEPEGFSLSSACLCLFPFLLHGGFFVEFPLLDFPEEALFLKSCLKRF